MNYEQFVQNHPKGHFCQSEKWAKLKDNWKNEVVTVEDENGNIKQKTEDIVGPYELHDFFMYNFLRYGFSVSKIFFLAKNAFEGKYDNECIKKWSKISKLVLWRLVVLLNIELSYFEFAASL